MVIEELKFSNLESRKLALGLTLHFHPTNFLFSSHANGL